MTTDSKIEMLLADQTLAIQLAVSAMERSPVHLERALRTVRMTTRHLRSAVFAQIRALIATAATDDARRHLAEVRAGSPPAIHPIIPPVATFAVHWEFRWHDQLPITRDRGWAYYHCAYRLALLAQEAA
jgi:hypothetical protein